MQETTLFLFFEVVRAIMISLVLVFGAWTVANGPFWLIATVFTATSWSVKKAIVAIESLASRLFLIGFLVWNTFKWLVQFLLSTITFPIKFGMDFQDKRKRISLWQEATMIVTLLAAFTIAAQLTRTIGFTGNLLESLLYLSSLIVLGMVTATLCFIQTNKWLKYKIKKNDPDAAAELQRLHSPLTHLIELKKLLRNPRA